MIASGFHLAMYHPFGIRVNDAQRVEYVQFIVKFHGFISIGKWNVITPWYSEGLSQFVVQVLSS